MTRRLLLPLVRRVCTLALAVALAYAPVAAEAFFVPHYQRAWPALKDSTSYTYICARVMTPAGAGASETTTLSFLGHTGCLSPNYATSAIRVRIDNFTTYTTGAANPEHCAGSAATIDFITLFVGATAYPVTFGGAIGINVSDCQFIWSDPVLTSTGAPLSLPANTQYYVRMSRTIPSGANQIYGNIGNGFNPTYDNAYAGILSDGFGGYATPQMSLRSSGTVPGGNGTGSFAMTPAAIVGQGWDGSAAYAVVGDSIGWGQNDYSYYAPSVSGAEYRALADASGAGPRTFVPLTVPGTKPEDQSSIAAGQWQLRMRALRSVPNRPFNQVLSEMGQNSPTMNYSDAAHFALFQAVEEGFWGFWRNECPECSIFQVTFPSHAGSSDKFTTLAGQTTDYPNGMRWQAGAWFKNGPLPSYVTGIDLTTAFTTGSGFASQAGLWPVTGWQGTVSTAVSSGKSIVVTGPSAPLNATYLIIGLGTGSVETHDIVKVSGSGPWTLSLDGNISHAWSVGAQVNTALTQEGTHPYYPLYQAAANALIALKGSVLP